MNTPVLSLWLSTNLSLAAIVAAGAIACGSACGSASSPASSPASGASGAHPARAATSAQPSGPVIVELRVVSAEIHGQMVDGQPWDRSGQKSEAIHPTLDRYLEQHTELARTRKHVGIPIDNRKLKKKAKKGPAADPMVLLDIGGQVFRSPIRPNAFYPAWDFTVQFVAHRPEQTSVRVHLVDYDGPGRHDSIGSTVLPLHELIARPLHQLPQFGAVGKLILEVQTRPMPESGTEPKGTRLAIPGKPTWTDTGIRITAGQRVHIAAADEVCSKNAEKCSGPEGQRDPSEDYNHKGFEYLGHAALIAALGDTRFAVGRDLQFIAPASGILRLGVNDIDSYNNTGSYAVQVQIEPTPVAID